MAEDKMLREAITAIAQGQRSRARDLLTRLIRADQANPRYWLWMSAVVDTNKERVYCLQNALRLDPQNQLARLGLIVFGALKPDTQETPAPIIPREWESQFNPGQRNQRRQFFYRLLLGFSTLLLLFILGGMILGQRLGIGGIFGAPPLMVTPRFVSLVATPTFLPTNTPWKSTPTPTFSGPIPLEMLLEATYTPTPLYVDTPHPISEAYQAGLRALREGDLEGMLRYMQQAARDEPAAPDTHYYVGEAYRMLGDFSQAVSAYTRAIESQVTFAPAYLGRARANLFLGDLTAAEEDLLTAIEHDPNLIEAYLELAALHIQQEQYEKALADLEVIADRADESPWWHYHRARVALGLGETQTALVYAQRAHALDLTFLPVYLTLGQASLAVGDPVAAVDYLETYLRYQDQDALAWLTLGQAIFTAEGDYQTCVSALDQALSVEAYRFPALLYRGLCYLELGEGQLAVNDLIAARNLDRSSFAASLGLGRGLMMTGRAVEAVSQITAALEIATDDRQRAEVYYWRSIVLQSMGNTHLASADWEALLALPPESVPEDWRVAAQQNLLLLTPSPTASPITATPSAIKPDRTPTFTPSSP